jgi:prepilin signal peptidase PulO-like enzyme (type II secretory pathway)
MEYFFIFIFGTFIGSFLTVVIDRLPQKQSIIWDRSHCDHCRRKLAWFELVPVASYFLIGGKCRTCHTPLSVWYPIIETITGALFVLIIMSIGFTNPVMIIYFFFIVAVLIAIFFTDLKYGIIPFPIVLFASVITLLYQIVFVPFVLVGSLLSAFGIFLFFLALFLGTKGRGIGFGDVCYVVLMGLLLGFPKIILGFYLSFVIGALVSLLLIALKKKRFKGSTIPFGPFLTLGTLISFLWGDALLELIFGYLFMVH